MPYSSLGERLVINQKEGEMRESAREGKRSYSCTLREHLCKSSIMIPAVLSHPRDSATMTAR